MTSAAIAHAKYASVEAGVYVHARKRKIAAMAHPVTALGSGTWKRVAPSRAS